MAADNIQPFSGGSSGFLFLSFRLVPELQPREGQQEQEDVKLLSPEKLLPFTLWFYQSSSRQEIDPVLL